MTIQKIQEKGIIRWFALHSVAANLLMFVCLFGGLLFMTRIPQEVMPDFSLDTITVTTMYAGASPSEIESGVLLAIEDSISGLTGVDEVTATAKEGKGVVIIDVIDGQNIKNFPKTFNAPSIE